MYGNDTQSIAAFALQRFGVIAPLGLMYFPRGTIKDEREVLDFSESSAAVVSEGPSLPRTSKRGLGPPPSWKEFVGTTGWILSGAFVLPSSDIDSDFANQSFVVQSVTAATWLDLPVFEEFGAHFRFRARAS